MTTPRFDITDPANADPDAAFDHPEGWRSIEPDPTGVPGDTVPDVWDDEGRDVHADDHAAKVAARADELRAQHHADNMASAARLRAAIQSLADTSERIGRRLGDAITGIAGEEIAADFAGMRDAFTVLRDELDREIAADEEWAANRTAASTE